jgi:hypothetical protein
MVAGRSQLAREVEVEEVEDISGRETCELCFDSNSRHKPDVIGQAFAYGTVMGEGRKSKLLFFLFRWHWINIWD